MKAQVSQDYYEKVYLEIDQKIEQARQFKTEILEFREMMRRESERSQS